MREGVMDSGFSGSADSFQPMLWYADPAESDSSSSHKGVVFSP